MIHAIDCIYNIYKLITDTYTAGQINDIFIDNIIEITKTQYHEQVMMLIFLTPTFQHHIYANERNNVGLQRFSDKDLVREREIFDS